MIVFGILVLLALLSFVLAARGGLSNVARSRKYKSGTGWCFWRWTETDSEYILRLHIVKTPWFAVCLHWIRKPDAEPYLHDHPVSFLSIVLRGKYAELRQKRGDFTPRYLVHRWFNFIRASEHDTHHIIFTRKNTLTLCFMGPKTREWGYHGVRRPGDWMGWKHYEEYIKASKDALGDKETWARTWKEIEDAADMMGERFEQTYNATLFVDEEARRISPVAGDFDDEAPTEPWKP